MDKKAKIKIGIITFLVLVGVFSVYFVFAQGEEPVYGKDNSPGFIGYGGDFEWNFEIKQEDTDIYTEVEVINETVLEITVKAKHDLPGGYKWDMAICNIESFDSLKYMEEDSQGGFENSYAEDLNYIKLEYEGMPNTWCEEMGNYGFVLFSSGSKNQLPEHFRIIFSEGKNEFKMFTGSGTEVLIGKSHTIGGTEESYMEKMVKDSTGRLHVMWINNGNDLVYANSTDNGATWDSVVIDSGYIRVLNLVINSSDGLWILFRDIDTLDMSYMTSNDYGVTWSDLELTPFLGNTTQRFNYISAVMDNNDNIHLCGVTGVWNNDWNNHWLAYCNYSDGAWSEIVWINTDSADDTDRCDIETDSNGVVYIVGSGSDGDDIDLWTSVGGLDSARYTIHSSSGDTNPGIFIDKNDKIAVAWEQDSDDLGFANSTSALATTSWTLTTVDSDSSNYPDVKITDDGDFFILYNDDTSSNYDILVSYLLADSSSWVVREILKDDTWATKPYASMRGSRVGNDTITDRIDYVYYSDTDDSVYFDYFALPETDLPVVTQVSPADDYSETSSSVIDFKYNVTDLSNIKNCSLIIDNIINDTQTNPAKDGTNTFSFFLNDGDYWWEINCTDYWNNIGGSGKWNISINVPHDLLITDPTTSNPKDTSGGSNITTTFNYVMGGENVTSEVTIENITIGGTECVVVPTLVSSAMFDDVFEDDDGVEIDAHTPTPKGIGWTLVFQDDVNADAEIISNRVQPDSSDGNDGFIYAIDDTIPDADYNVSFTVVGIDSGDDTISIIARYIDNSNFYAVRLSESSGYNILYKFFEGGKTELDTTSLSPPNDGDVILFSLSGDSLKVYWEGDEGSIVEQLSATDLSLTGAGKAGFGMGQIGSGYGSDDVDSSYMIVDDFTVVVLAFTNTYYEDGWKVKCTVPTDSFEGLQDLFLNATWFDKITRNDTQTNAINYVAEDTCTYTSGNWNVECSDYCNITDVTSLPSNNLTLNGTGIFTILANITVDMLIMDTNCKVVNLVGDNKNLMVV